MFAVEEIDLFDMAQSLRQHMEETIKLEVAPWSTSSHFKMDDLYTDLTLEKLDWQPHGLVKAKEFSDYKDLFPVTPLSSMQIEEPIPEEQYMNDDCHVLCFGCKKRCKCCLRSRDQNNNSPTANASSRIRKPKGKKVLIQGKPGMGKTTIAKKIAFDWAKGEFTRFVIIFLVILKLAEPGDSTEAIITNQLPELTGLDSRGHSLKQLLDNFGERCLIILDGLDELGPKENKDISKTIRGEKLPHCHIVVTSRPH